MKKNISGGTQTVPCTQNMDLFNPITIGLFLSNIGWGGGADIAPPGISGDNAHTRVVLHMFMNQHFLARSNGN